MPYAIQFPAHKAYLIKKSWFSKAHSNSVTILQLNTDRISGDYHKPMGKRLYYCRAISTNIEFGSCSACYTVLYRLADVRKIQFLRLHNLVFGFLQSLNKFGDNLRLFWPDRQSYHFIYNFGLYMMIGLVLRRLCFSRQTTCADRSLLCRGGFLPLCTRQKDHCSEKRCGIRLDCNKPVMTRLTLTVLYCLRHYNLSAIEKASLSI